MSLKCTWNGSGNDFPMVVSLTPGTSVLVDGNVVEKFDDIRSGGARKNLELGRAGSCAGNERTP
jgi:hypothetical protein